MRKKIEKFFNENYKDTNIINMSTGDLVMNFYSSQGMNPTETTREWLVGVADKKYPPYTEAYGIIKDLRKTNPLWTKQYKKKA